MLGLFSKPDTKNPICAPIFAKIHDDMFGAGTSKRAFGVLNRYLIDKIGAGKFAEGRDFEQAMDRCCRLSYEQVLRDADTCKHDISVAPSYGVRHAAVLTFAVAPVLGVTPELAHCAAIWTAFTVKSMLFDDPSPFVRRAGSVIMLFGLGFDMEAGHYSRTEWERGYEHLMAAAA